MIFGTYQEVGTVTRAVGVGSDVTRVVIENGYGHIKVEPGRSGLVEVIARFKAPSGADYAVSDQDVEITSGDGKLKIRAVETPKALQRRKVYWEIRVPMVIGVRARNGVGNIDVSGLNGEHDLRTGVGNITVRAERICGNSRFRAGTGKVDVHAHRLEGEPGLLTGVGNLTLQAGSVAITHASLKCATGNVQLKLPATYIGHVDFKTGVGRIVLGDDGGLIPVSTNFIGSRAKGLLGQGPGDIESKTGVGNITLNRA